MNQVNNSIIPTMEMMFSRWQSATPEQREIAYQLLSYEKEQQMDLQCYGVTEVSKMVNKSRWYLYDLMNRGLLPYRQDHHGARTIMAYVIKKHFGPESLTWGTNKDNERSAKARRARMVALEARAKNKQQLFNKEILTQDNYAIETLAGQVSA